MITVENLSKSFTKDGSLVHALRDVSIDINAGSLYGVVGPQGAGKSTLARCIALRERPDRGVVRLDGLNIGALEGRRLREVRRQVGVVAAKPELFAERTVAGNIAAPLEQLGVAGPSRKSKVANLLDLVGLTPRAAARPTELTAGQRHRVAIARALALAPSLLLVDDPTAGVSTEESASVLATLDRARGELGVTTLVATSDTGVIRRVCDGLAVLDEGALREHGRVLELLTEPNSYTAQALLPSVANAPTRIATFDRVADVVLIGFAAIGALLPEAATRFGAEVATVGGGLTRFGDVPVARFRIGLRGGNTEGALAWIADRGAHVASPTERREPLAA